MFGSLFRLGVLATLIGGSTLALVGPQRIKMYFDEGKDSVLEALDDAQSMESKLGMIRKQIGSLDQEIRHLKGEAVKRRIESEHLHAEVQERERSLAQRSSVLEKASDLLALNKDRYVIGRMVYDRAEIEADAQEKLGLYNVQAETLASLKETLATKEKAQAIAEQNVTRAAALRVDLESRVGLLEAQLQKFRAKETFAATVDEILDTSGLDSDLARAREMIKSFERDLEVKDRMLDERLSSGPEQPQGGIDYEALQANDEDLVGLIRSALRGGAEAGAAALPATVEAPAVH
ncbi:MAG: hypothetical protein HY812_15375 [Planctomycetes bacterium]|nr:hypothetical protein [Planctomycetota bacterium]